LRPKKIKEPQNKRKEFTIKKSAGIKAQRSTVSRKVKQCADKTKKQIRRKGKIVNARKKETHESHQQQIYAFSLFLEWKFMTQKSSTFVCFFTILKFFFSKQSNSNKVKPLETVKKENWIHIWFNKVSHMEHVRMNFPCSAKVFLNEQESFFIYENLSRFVSLFLLSIELFLLKNFQFSFLINLKLSLLQLKIFLVFLS